MSYHSYLTLSSLAQNNWTALSLTYKVLTSIHPSYLRNLISDQHSRSTRSSSVVTLARPPTSSSLRRHMTRLSFRFRYFFKSALIPQCVNSTALLINVRQSLIWKVLDGNVCWCMSYHSCIIDIISSNRNCSSSSKKEEEEEEEEE